MLLFEIGGGSGCEIVTELVDLRPDQLDGWIHGFHRFGDRPPFAVEAVHIELFIFILVHAIVQRGFVANAPV